MATTIVLAPHPLADLGAFTASFPTTMPGGESPSWLTNLLAVDTQAPLQPDDKVRSAVRDLLRFGGFKPTGRSKPSSEYLLRAGENGVLASINAAVDACNAASLHSGLPISVIDLQRALPPLRIGIAEAGMQYPFNPSGQVIDVSGLLCLVDAEGPCANAVKDAQRTKTDDRTSTTLSVVWGARSLSGRTERTVAWYRELVERIGGQTESVDFVAT